MSIFPNCCIYLWWLRCRQHGNISKLLYIFMAAVRCRQLVNISKLLYIFMVAVRCRQHFNIYGGCVV